MKKRKKGLDLEAQLVNIPGSKGGKGKKSLFSIKGFGKNSDLNERFGRKKKKKLF